MGVKRFFELANRVWPVEENKPRHAVVFDPEKGLVVTIWLKDKNAWQWFVVNDSEFDDPEGLIADMIRLMEESGVHAP